MPHLHTEINLKTVGFCDIIIWKTSRTTRVSQHPNASLQSNMWDNSQIQTKFRFAASSSAHLTMIPASALYALMGFDYRSERFPEKEVLISA